MNARPESIVKSEHASVEIARLERLARVMDDWIAIPFTRFRIGLDPILGLVPGLGDAIAAIFSLAIIGTAIRHGVPKRVVLRMAVNVALDYWVGILPGVGDVADAFVKSNRWNLALLREHVAGVPLTHEPVSRRWVFAVLLALALFILAGIVLTLLAVGAIVRHGGVL